MRAIFHPCWCKGSAQLSGSTVAAPVGILPACTYDIGSITLHPEDILVAYTDGVIETRNMSGQQFGVNRLVGIVTASEDRTPGALSADIMTAVEAFSGG